MLSNTTSESDLKIEPCLACQAERRWQDHLAEFGTPPDAADFLKLWPHADVATLLTILGVLVADRGRIQSRRLASLCQCKGATRGKQEPHEALSHEGSVPISRGEGIDGVVEAATKGPPAASVPRRSRRGRHVAIACIGLAVVIGGAIGWQEFFNVEIGNTCHLGRSGSYGQIIELWEADTLDAIDECTIIKNGREIVSLDLLDENRGNLLSIAGIDGPDSVDAELVKQLIRGHFHTVRALLGKTEQEVNSGVDAMLEQRTEPVWAWLKFVVRPVRKLLLRAAENPEDRDN